VQIVSSIEQANGIRDPKVVLASGGTLEAGPVRNLLLRYGSIEGQHHVVLLTDKTMMASSLARRMVGHLEAHRTAAMDPAELPLELKHTSWAYKTGQDLVLWKLQRKERLAADARARRRAQEQTALQGDMAMDGMDVYAIIGGKSGAKPLSSVDEVVMGAPEKEQKSAAELDKVVEDGKLAQQQQLQQQQQQQQQQEMQRQGSGTLMDDEAKTGGGLFSVFARQQQQRDLAAPALRNNNTLTFSAYEAERTKRWDEYGEIVVDEDFVQEGAGEGKPGKGNSPGEDVESDSDSGSNVLSDGEREDEAKLAPAKGGDMDVDERNGKARCAKVKVGANNGDGDDDDDGAGMAPELRARRRRHRATTYGNPVEDAMLARDKRAALPRQVVTRTTRTMLRCGLAYVDTESRATGVDLRNIINMLRPRKVSSCMARARRRTSSCSSAAARPCRPCSRRASARPRT
jgi:hypothetical protein